MKPESGRGVSEFAALQAAARLDRIAYQVGRARKSKRADTVHELRVAIRRFVSCLNVYPQFFPAKESKKVRKRLKKVMEAAGEVRDRDIALHLGKQANLPKDNPVMTGMRQQRKVAAKALAASLEPWTRRERFPKWRHKLNLP